MNRKHVVVVGLYSRGANGRVTFVRVLVILEVLRFRGSQFDCEQTLMLCGFMEV
jgi:hypothetical protein